MMLRLTRKLDARDINALAFNDATPFDGSVPDGTIYFTDRDQSYRAVLYRCSKNKAAPKSGDD